MISCASSHLPLPRPPIPSVSGCPMIFHMGRKTRKKKRTQVATAGLEYALCVPSPPSEKRENLFTKGAEKQDDQERVFCFLLRSTRRSSLTCHIRARYVCPTPCGENLCQLISNENRAENEDGSPPLYATNPSAKRFD